MTQTTIQLQNKQGELVEVPISLKYNEVWSYKYSDAYKDMFKSLNQIFNVGHFNNKNAVGSIMYLLRVWECETFEEFYEIYIKEIGIERLFNHSQEFKVYAANYKVDEHKNVVMNDIEAFYMLVAYILLNSWEGTHREQIVEEELERRYGDEFIIEQDAFLDDSYNIDFIIRDPFGATCGIQVKPMSYKFADAQTKIINKQKEEKFMKDFHLPTRYIFVQGGRIVNEEIFEAIDKDLKRIR
jgi:hypothetical protein